MQIDRWLNREFDNVCTDGLMIFEEWHWAQSDEQTDEQTNGRIGTQIDRWLNT
jgi:hypothetical protein